MESPLRSGIVLEDFGQKVDLTRRIREVLLNYPEGTTVLKELVQNADDAGATVVKLCIDCRVHGTGSLLSSALTDFQLRPALLAYNDAIFSEADFRSISKIGASGKNTAKSWKTGRFGVGFNSVYHLTDLPSFASGNYVVMFDPQLCFLPNVSSSNPGKRIDFVKTNVLRVYPDQFSPFVAFGCDMTDNFHGTLFRFPLRSPSLAVTSSLSKQAYNAEDIVSMFSQLFDEGIFSLLFLKNLLNIEMYMWEVGEAAPRILYSCRVSSIRDDVKCHRQALLKLSKELDEHREEKLDAYSIEFVCENFGDNEKSFSTFLVVQCMASSRSRIDSFAKKAAAEYDMNLIPWGAVAACVSSITNNSGEITGGDLRIGRAFCFLPLPVKTGLTFQVNGYFEVASNRRGIWYGGDMDRSGKVRSIWNRLILEDIICVCFKHMLIHLRESMGPTDEYYSFWPVGSFDDPWTILVKRVYKEVSDASVLFSEVGGGKWLSPVEAFLHDKVFNKSDELGDALLTLNMPIVCLPSSLFDMLLNNQVSFSQKLVCPEAIRQFLRECCHLSSLSKSYKLVLLEYCLQDLIDANVGKELNGLHFLPIANGKCDFFSVASEKTSPYFVCDETEYLLLERVSDRVIDRNIPKNIFDRLLATGKCSTSNIRGFNIHHFLSLFSRLVPMDWHHKDKVLWDPKSHHDQPSTHWLTLFWRYIETHCENLFIFSEWPIIPSTSGYLYRPSGALKLLNDCGIPAAIQRILLKMGCKILDSSIGVSHPDLSSYLYDLNIVGILNCILDGIASEGGMIQIQFNKLDDHEKNELFEFLLDPKWYIGVSLDSSLIKRFRRLPIYRVYDRAEENTYRFCELENPTKFLQPKGVAEEFLDSTFIASKSSCEVDVLIRYFGVERMQETHFYTHHVFVVINELEPVSRDKVMLSILEKLPHLCFEDPSFKDVMRNLEFVPTSLGLLKSPLCLYDPRNEDLGVLLDDFGSFPSGPFKRSEILDMLCTIGLKTSVSCETIIEAARQVEKLVHEDQQKALCKGKSLLSYLEVNATKWVANQSNSIFARASTILNPRNTNREFDKFWNELRMICWCPAMVKAPFQTLPWPDVTSIVAPPKVIRLPADMWLVSASMRILDGECSSSALSYSLGWLSPPAGSVIAAQLLDLGMNNETVSDQTLRHELALAMPRIYSIMLKLLPSDEMEIIKAILEGSRWIWVGDGFATSSEVVLEGPLHLAPYVRVIPTDLAVFKDLFLELGVKEQFRSVDFANILSKMALKKGSIPLDGKELRAVILIIHHVDEANLDTRETKIYVPDNSGRLFLANDLVFNDAPWLIGAYGTGELVSGAPTFNISANMTSLRYVHGSISHAVAERLGVRSLRRSLLAESANSMTFGLSGTAEAFGQHEALTTRLRHILEMYADGPGILFELIQNAEDAGASVVNFLLDKSQYGTNSVLSLEMADWQGAALYCFNDSTFSTQDLYAISRIGQESKLEKPFAIGRFGLGFNCVYHFTDVPTFVSGENIVMFDPHACNLPGVSPSHPGLRIKFSGTNVLEQFPDQFSPLMHFGCDLQGPFAGTLFRFPLRNATTAPRSEIKKEKYDSSDVISLFNSFSNTVSDVLLFLRNVREISIFVKEGNDSEMTLLHRVQRSTIEASEMTNGEFTDVFKLINHRQQSIRDRGQLLKRLKASIGRELPYRCQKVLVKEQKVSSNLLHGWITVECLGRGPSSKSSILTKEAEFKLIPFACVAMHIQTVQMELRSELDLFHISTDVSANRDSFEGRAFCFLPLPISTYLPVNVNAYFELSSNRRDLWYGNDMIGDGKKRSEWNMYILEDVVVPAYAQLLERMGKEIGPCQLFFSSWPTSANGYEPWASMVQKLYSFVANSDLRVLYTKARNGQWISAKQGLFPDFKFDKVDELVEVLTDSGLPLVQASQPLVDQFMKACPSLNFLAPHLLRTLLARRKRDLKNKSSVIAVLEYCLMDFNAEFHWESLCGLSLIPLADGSVSRFEKCGAGDRIFVAKGDEYDLLVLFLPYQLVDCVIPNDVHDKLWNITKSGKLNLSFLSCDMLEKLFYTFLPPEWQFSNTVTWHPGESGHPTSEWICLLWRYLKTNCEDLSCFSKWPILPVGDANLARLDSNACVIIDDGWSENMHTLLLKIGCQFLRRDIPIEHPQLVYFVQPPTASGILNAVLAIAGELQGIANILTDVSYGELRELRSFIMQSKWFSENSMSEKHIDIIKHLPIFESYQSRKLSCLNNGLRWLKPADVLDDLLDDSFVKSESDKERLILKNFLDVSELSKEEYYTKYVLVNIPKFIWREGSISAILHDMKLLLDKDSRFKSMISSIPFVMTANRSWEEPSRLYDPRVPELKKLLHEENFFPSSEFLDQESLDILVSLGLKKALGFSGLIDCAKSVKLKHDSSDTDAENCAKMLLACLDALSVETTAGEKNVLESVGARLQDDEGSSGNNSSNAIQQQGDLMTSLTFNPDAGLPSKEFWSELKEIPWCPTLLEPPIAGLPWIQSTRSFAPPTIVRPMQQMWIVSCTMHILNSECKSNYLHEKLGWTECPSVEVLVSQLTRLSTYYEDIKLQPSLRSNVDVLLKDAIPQIYSKMCEYVDTSDLMPMKRSLGDISWVWIGDDFVKPSVLAFDSPVNFTPYLFAVPSELHGFKELLVGLGVRLCFEFWDYLHVLERLRGDANDHSLSEDQLCFANRVLEAVADCCAEKPLLKNDLTSLLLPDSLGILRHSVDLVYNDAPWLDNANIAGKFFLHSSISNDLANKLGLKLLSRFSFVNDDATKNVPCMEYFKIKELLKLYGENDLLSFDLIELADCCKGKKVHLIFDKRKHSKLSLLQHNLGNFQGPSLVAVLEGVSLSREEISNLQFLPPLKLRGDALNYGLGLQSCFSICDILTIVSGGNYYIFDPRCAALGDSRSRATAKVFSLVGTNLIERFPDQFRPMLFGQNMPWSHSDSTIIRMPLLSEFLQDEMEPGILKVKKIFDTLKKHASTTLIFLKSIVQISLSTLEEGSSQMQEEFSAFVDPSAAALRNPFAEKKWRKFHISRLFNSSSVVTKVHVIDVNVCCGATSFIDRWLVVLSLGSGQSRNMALDRRYLAYNLTPVAGVAAHISRDGKPSDIDFEGAILSPLPLSVHTTMPVAIFGYFLACHNAGRTLFNKREKNSLFPDREFMLIDAWNIELMSCVRDSYVEMVIELQKLGIESSSSNIDVDVGRAAAISLKSYRDKMYHFWPKSEGMEKQHANSLIKINIEKHKPTQDILVEQIIKPFYARVANIPLWQLYSGNYVKCDDGMFLSQPGNDVCNSILPTTVCSFVKEHYPVFSVPWELVAQLQSVGVDVKEIKPKMIRDLLKLSHTSNVVQSIDTFVDVLEYCLSDVDLNGEIIENGGSSNEIRLMPNYLGSSTQRASSSGDAFEVVTNLGKALFDFGRVVVEDIGRAGGPLVQRNNFVEENSHIFNLLREVKGLPCPTASSHLTRFGVSELWLGDKDQQFLMMPLASKFIHPKVMERTVLSSILSTVTLKSLLKVKDFSIELLSSHMQFLFHKSWVNHVTSLNSAPWFSWDNTNECNGDEGPSHGWIRLFWNYFDGSLENLGLIRDWPLIPAFLGTTVLCRVKERPIIFFPSLVESSDNAGVNLTDLSTSELSNISFEAVKSKYPWLFPLLNKFSIPIYDEGFVESAVSCGCLSVSNQSLGKIIASKLLYSKLSGYFPNVLPLSELEREELLKLFSRDFVSNSLNYEANEREVLRSLPMYKTCLGSYTHLNEEEHFICSSNSILKPSNEYCLAYSIESPESSFLRSLGVPELGELQILIKFGLPGFENKPHSEQEDILFYLYANWRDLQNDSTLLEVLKETKFVKNANQFSGELSRPKEMFDPSDKLLSSVFSGERNIFPGERFSTDGWLRILRKIGLRNSSEADTILDCARKVESLGSESLASTGNLNIMGDEQVGEIPLELWSLAASVVESIFANFAVFYGNNFCNALSSIVCVPAEHGFPGASSKRVLTSFSKAILFKDWPLSWSSSPILSKQSVIPPEYSWGALHLRSPPPYSTVLDHLQTIGKNGGEDTLTRWLSSPSLMSVVEASCEVLKYLDKIWHSLSSSDIKELESVAFIPAANGTRLVMASSLFVRLPINLSPFAFELQSTYLPYINILKDLGLHDALSEAVAINLLTNLQRRCGYQRLNPNEMRAVLEILNFLVDWDGNVGGADIIVPDDGGRLIFSSSCVYVDSYGSRFVNSIDTSRLRFLHPDVPQKIPTSLGIKKLSDVVIEELVNVALLQPLEFIGDVNLTHIKSKLTSRSFQNAVWCFDHSLSFEKLKYLLEQIASKLQFVKYIDTRFLLLPKFIDITSRKTSSAWDEGFVHRSVYFIDQSKSTILIAEPPPYIPILDVLAIVISYVIGSPSALPLGSLFLCPDEFEAAILLKLKLNLETKGSEFSCNDFVGNELLPQDALHVQLHPLRPFYKEEIIAWKSPNATKLKYGKVPEDVRPPPGHPLYRISVETLPGVVESLLSSQVYSFKSVSLTEEFSVETSQVLPIHRSSEISGSSSSQQSIEVGNVSASEVVEAVREMLHAAGIDMDVEKQELLDSSLTLQQQLKESQAAFLLEQERADQATKDAEQAKGAWTCRVCLSNEVNVAMVPCGHVLCRGCSSAVSRCPFCRLQVSKTLRIFRP